MRTDSEHSLEPWNSTRRVGGYDISKRRAGDLFLLVSQKDTCTDPLIYNGYCNTARINAHVCPMTRTILRQKTLGLECGLLLPGVEYI